MGYFLKSVMILLIFTYRKCKIRWRLACLLKETIRTLMKHVFYKKLISLLTTEDHCLTFGLGCVWNANGGTCSCQNWSLYTVRAAVIPRVFNETWRVLALHQKNVCTCDRCQHIPSNCITLDPKILQRCWGFNHTFNIRGVSVSIFPFFFWTVSQKRTFLLLTLFSPEVSVSTLLKRIIFTVPFTAGGMRRVIAIICGFSEECEEKAKTPSCLCFFTEQKNGRQDFSELQRSMGFP